MQHRGRTRRLRGDAGAGTRCARLVAAGLIAVTIASCDDDNDDTSDLAAYCEAGLAVEESLLEAQDLDLSSGDDVDAWFEQLQVEMIELSPAAGDLGQAVVLDSLNSSISSFQVVYEQIDGEPTADQVTQLGQAIAGIEGATDDLVNSLDDEGCS